MAYNAADIFYFHQQARHAIRMARAYWTSNRRMRVIWQERAADYRECIIDGMRKRQGWTLAQRQAGKQ